MNHVVRTVFFSLLLSTSAFADKMDAYSVTCQKTALAIFTDYSKTPNPDLSKLKKNAYDTCKAMMEHLTEYKRWDQVKDPAMDACADAVHILVGLSSQKQFELRVTAEQCAQYLK